MENSQRTDAETNREIYRMIGRTKVTVNDLPDLQIDFLSELCKLWPHTHARFCAEKDLAGPQREDEMARIAADEKPIIVRANLLIKVIWHVRIEFVRSLLVSDTARQQAIERCRDDPIFFINHFCCIHEPRMPEIGLPADLPFVMYPSQQKIVEEIDSAYRNRQDLLVEKSREAGITWGFAALLVHHWKYLNGFTAVVASEKEEKVDILGSRKPLFGKLRHLVYNLPSFLRPATYDVQNGPNDNFRRMVNPDNGAEITGEAGANIGRSGRASIVIIDESQAIENPDQVDTSLESVTNCRVDVGTPLGMNHFGIKRHSGKVRVVTIPWWEDPRKNPDWRTGEKNLGCAWRKYIEDRREAVVIAQEYDLDYKASVEGLFIPSKYVQAAVDFNLPADGECVGGFDIAGKGKNESVYVRRRGPRVFMPHGLPFDTSTEAMWDCFNRAEGDKVQALHYDMDGIGESVWGQLKTSGRELTFKVYGVSGNSPLDKNRWLEDEDRFASEKFLNKRAEMWWNLRERFRKTYEHRAEIRLYSANEMISIPNHAKLIEQLSGPLLVYSKAGKIGVESKQDMRKRGVKSPDFADALAYAFSDFYGDEVIDKFDYTSQHFKDFDVDPLTSVGDSFVSIYQDEDNTSHVLCCLWCGRSKGLFVYGEREVQGSLPQDVMAYVYQTMHPELKHIREWVANAEMFTNMQRGEMAPWRVYRKAGINLKQNYLDNERGSKMLVNEMFSQGAITIHRRCTRLFSQIRGWRHQRERQHSTGVETAGLAKSLCLLVTRMRRLRLIMIEDYEDGTYGRPGNVSRRFEYESGRRGSADSGSVPAGAERRAPQAPGGDDYGPVVGGRLPAGHQA